MDAIFRNSEVAAVFAEPWTYPGLPQRAADSSRLIFGARHHLVWSEWIVFDDGTNAYVRRIIWPCSMGLHRPTGQYTRTFASESLIDRQLADSLYADAIHMVGLGAPTEEMAIGIDGSERHLACRYNGGSETIQWNASVDAPVDTWFSKATAALDARLPENRAWNYYLIGPGDVSSSEASNPRVER